MSTAIKETFRRVVTLKDGARLLVRPMITTDLDALRDLYATATPDDMLLLSQDFRNEEILNHWVSQVEYSHTLPLLALIDHKLVGHAILERRGGPYRHIGDIYVYLAHDFRARGLGTIMIDTLVQLARKESLHWLQATALSSQTKVIRAIEGVGFVSQCFLADFIMREDGRTDDITIMHMRLLEHSNDF